MRDATKGRTPDNDALTVLHTYQEMSRLAELGITFDVDSFDPELIEALSLVGLEYIKNKPKPKKKAKKGRIA